MVTKPGAYDRGLLYINFFECNETIQGSFTCVIRANNIP